MKNQIFFSLGIIIVVLSVFIFLKTRKNIIFPIEKNISITTPSERARNYCIEALTAYLNADTINYLRFYQKALEADSTFFMANYQLAICNILSKNIKEFKKYGEVAAKCTIKLSHGELLLKGALSILLKDNNPDFTITRRNQIKLVKIGKKLIRRYPQDKNAYLNCFTYQSIINDKEGKIKTLNGAMKYAAKNAPFYAWLGFAYMHMDKIKEAEFTFNECNGFSGYKELSNFQISKGKFLMYIEEYKNAYICFMTAKDYKNAYDCSVKAYDSDTLWSKEKAKEAKILLMNSVRDIDGNVYRTVKIGDQIWMQSNLTVAHYRNGDLIPVEKEQKEWVKLTTGAWCYFSHFSGNVHDKSIKETSSHRDETERYGKLYNWYAVNDLRGLAPSGWHVASDREWSKLISNLRGRWSTAGKIQFRAERDQNGRLIINEKSFDALPGGFRTDDLKDNILNFYPDQYYYAWWSSTESDIYNSSSWIFTDTGYGGDAEDKPKKFGMYVRCIKD